MFVPDLKREYRFGMMFAPQPGADVAQMVPRALKLADALSAEVPNGPRLRVKFGDPETAEQLVVGAGGVQKFPVLTWKSNVWELSWSPHRLDVNVDARAYEEVAERPLLLDDVRRRISPNLVRAMDLLELPVARLVLVTLAHASESKNGDAVRAVAARMFSARVNEEAQNGELLELSSSVNRNTHLPLPLVGRGPEAVGINRIERLSAEWSLTGGVARVSLRLHLDINTTPALEGALDSGAIDSFFESASNWSLERHNTVVMQ
ncbi:hypothetical protein L6R52_35495 [Myxococcota bacterium]|nr:hypothetical protein [Myxococcota bacterium]